MGHELLLPEIRESVDLVDFLVLNNYQGARATATSKHGERVAPRRFKVPANSRQRRRRRRAADGPGGGDDAGFACKHVRAMIINTNISFFLFSSGLPFIDKMISNIGVWLGL